jgi:hypothetical protein
MSVNSVCVIIVSWNTRELLRQCLNAIAAADEERGYDIIVVDNASEDGSAHMVRSDFPSVTLLENAKNVGFGTANNIGAAQTSCEYILLLNSDTIASRHSIIDLKQCFSEQPNVGAIGARLVLPNGKSQEFAYGMDPSISYLLRRAFVRKLFKRALHDWETRNCLHVDWVAATCILLRRSVFAAIGGFDTDYFMYFEDNDLCRRIRKTGGAVMYDPRVSITHLGGQSTKQSKRAQQAYYESLKTFYAKHYGPLAQFALARMLPLYKRLG